MPNHSGDVDHSVLRIGEESPIVSAQLEDDVWAGEEFILGLVEDTVEDLRLLDGVERLAVLDTVERRFMGALLIAQRIDSRSASENRYAQQGPSSRMTPLRG